METKLSTSFCIVRKRVVVQTLMHVDRSIEKTIEVLKKRTQPR